MAEGNGGSGSPDESGDPSSASDRGACGGDDLATDATPDSMPGQHATPASDSVCKLARPPPKADRECHSQLNVFGIHRDCGDRCKSHMFDAVIYHAEKDRKIAFSIKQELEANIRIFDQDSCHGPRIELLQNLDTSPYMKGLDKVCTVTRNVILLFTKSSPSDPLVEEGNYALWTKKAGTDLEIIPLVYGFDEHEDLPKDFSVNNAHPVRYEPGHAYFQDTMKKRVFKFLDKRLDHDVQRKECEFQSRARQRRGMHADAADNPLPAPPRKRETANVSGQNTKAQALMSGATGGQRHGAPATTAASSAPLDAESSGGFATSLPSEVVDDSSMVAKEVSGSKETRNNSREEEKEEEEEQEQEQKEQEQKQEQEQEQEQEEQEEEEDDLQEEEEPAVAGHSHKAEGGTCIGSNASQTGAVVTNDELLQNKDINKPAEKENDSDSNKASSSGNRMHGAIGPGPGRDTRSDATETEGEAEKGPAGGVTSKPRTASGHAVCGQTAGPNEPDSTGVANLVGPSATNERASSTGCIDGSGGDDKQDIVFETKFTPEPPSRRVERHVGTGSIGQQAAQTTASTGPQGQQAAQTTASTGPQGQQAAQTTASTGSIGQQAAQTTASTGPQGQQAAQTTASTSSKGRKDEKDSKAASSPDLHTDSEPLKQSHAEQVRQKPVDGKVKVVEETFHKEGYGTSLAGGVLPDTQFHEECQPKAALASTSAGPSPDRLPVQATSQDDEGKLGMEYCVNESPDLAFLPKHDIPFMDDPTPNSPGSSLGNAKDEMAAAKTGENGTDRPKAVSAPVAGPEPSRPAADPRPHELHVGDANFRKADTVYFGPVTINQTTVMAASPLPASVTTGQPSNTDQPPLLPAAPVPGADGDGDDDRKEEEERTAKKLLRRRSSDRGDEVEPGVEISDLIADTDTVSMQSGRSSRWSRLLCCGGDRKNKKKKKKTP